MLDTIGIIRTTATTSTATSAAGEAPAPLRLPLRLTSPMVARDAPLDEIPDRVVDVDGVVGIGVMEGIDTDGISMREDPHCEMLVAVVDAGFTDLRNPPLPLGSVRDASLQLERLWVPSLDEDLCEQT